MEHHAHHARTKLAAASESRGIAIAGGANEARANTPISAAPRKYVRAR
jgi:hypothetical protein